jgi:quercetin dioxygenase-like cupin family protein
VRLPCCRIGQHAINAHGNKNQPQASENGHQDEAKARACIQQLADGEAMKRLMLAVLVLAAITLTLADSNKKEIIAITPLQVLWLTPSYYTDGRERAQLLGDSSQGGAWIDRVKMPAGKRVLAHTHPQDEPVTVIEGTWYLGEGAKFDSTKLKGYPAGSFIVIPAGVPHFVAAKDGTVIVQLNGNGKFHTDYVEK